MEGPEVLCHWTARKMQPIILLWVASVFFMLMVLVYVVFHSLTGVAALFLGAIGYIVPLVPMTLSRMEYRLTEQKIEKRKFNEAEPTEFTDVVELDQLSHIVPIRFGFKFYKPLSERNPLRRFWMLHISEKYSGEVHVERADLAHVLDTLAQEGVPIR